MINSTTSNYGSRKGDRMALVKLGSDGLHRRGQAWFCTTGLPSDITVEVDEMLFHLHKFPLMSRSGRLTRLVTEACSNDDEEESCHIRLQGVPGGPETFDLVAKFCYIGVRMELGVANVAALRCAAQFLEMTEEYGEGNLIALTESFLRQVVVRSWNDSVRVLKSCEALLPQAEELLIVRKCVDSITMKACTDPSSFGWPMMEKGSLQSPDGTVLWNGISTGARPRNSRLDWWYQDISVLNLPLFKCVISAMEERGLPSQSIAGALMYYAKRSIPGLNRRQDSSFRAPLKSVSSEAEQRLLLETIESLLPSQEGVVSTRFLFGLLRTAMILKASPSCISSLECRTGAQLEQATVDELLIPNYSYSLETLYDMDCVQRILDHFLVSEKATRAAAAVAAASSPLVDEGLLVGSPTLTPLTKVAKLMDAYLAEVGPDINLKLAKFQSLVEAVPDYARVHDDGLYRAIDVFLKAHSWVTVGEREKLCSAIDCQKLSLEACTHAAQNERLPLRTVVQVLFFEQLQLRSAMAGCLGEEETARSSRAGAEGRQSYGGGAPHWVAALRENQALRADMAGMRRRVADLERECVQMRRHLRMKLAGWAAVSARLGCVAPTEDAFDPSARQKTGGAAAVTPPRGPGHHRRHSSDGHSSAPSPLQKNKISNRIK